MIGPNRGMAACGHFGILKSKGKLCGKCYQKQRRTELPNATCHADRKEHCAGLCSPCYRAGARAKRADCHPDRLHVARGQCRSCYQNDPVNKVYAIIARRLKKYGLSESRYAEIIESQKFHCAICGAEPTVVDHDHATGEVRGLLCRTCNTGLGHFRDNRELLSSAITYLERAKEKS